MVVHNCVKVLFTDIFYETRMWAVINYHKKILKQDITREEAGRTYLTKQEYMKVKPWWFLKTPLAWKLLIELKWCDPDWQAYSRACRERKAKMTRHHRQGSASMARFHKNLEKERGTAVPILEAYAYANRSERNGTFCNVPTTEVLEAYAEAFTEIHGPESNWRTEPIDGVAVHKAEGGKKHGRFCLLNGYLHTPSVLADVGMSRSLDDERPRRRSRPNLDDIARIEELERQLEHEREERERAREEMERAREEREQAREEMERARKEIEKEREQALQSKLNIDFLPPCPPSLTHLATSGSDEASTGNPTAGSERMVHEPNITEQVCLFLVEILAVAMVLYAVRTNAEGKMVMGMEFDSQENVYFDSEIVAV
uniref:Uncharacterized protein n=1 Tax=Oryza brachyantha TaxID=4533 RepID=J3MDC7_ORYBR